LRDIWVEAALQAIDDAGVDHVDSIYIGSMSSGLFTYQEHLASLLADYLGQCPAAATRVESACSSGGVSARMAWMEVAAGVKDIVLATGVEKMTDVSGGEATFALATAADQEYEVYHGATFPGLYAMIARSHMAKYGTTLEQLGHVAVKNHKNGAKNPLCQYPFEVTLDDVMKSTMVAEPLRILHCSPITDGAAALVFCPLEMARKISKKPLVKVLASAHATDSIALHERKDITVINSTVKAAAEAYKMAGKQPSDIHLAEVHDCFTIAEICVVEDLGFVEKGKGGGAAQSGLTAIGGKIPVNASGGLKSKGHPVGATGCAQLVELVKQLRGEAGERQVKGARVALAQNMGGTGGSSVVHILEVA
jgi:acetyl-CoA C-acetyltransferase